MEPTNNASPNFQFSDENLEQIPHPDDSPHLDANQSVPKNQSVAASPNDLESQNLYSRKPPKNFNDVTDEASSLIDNSNSFLPPLPPHQEKNILDTADIPLPKNFNGELNNILLPQSSPPLSQFSNNKKSDYNVQMETKFNISDPNIECEQEENIHPKNYIDDNKYSPSKVESDDENQDFATTKPKVLGKEQAKKRLMAFSLTKLSNSTPKKQNKVINSFKTIKEKPPNPNKSSGVQEQFRATISEIEEEKRKMMKNMPSYLLLEMNDLVKTSNVVIKPAAVSLDKGKKENSDLDSKDCSVDKNNVNKSKDFVKNKEKKSSQRSRSKSRNRSRSRSRSRSRNRNRSRNKKKRKSRSLSKSRRRSRSVDNSNVKSETLLLDWKSLKKAGFDVDKCIKSDMEETEKTNYGNWRKYSKEKSDFKPNFNYLKTYSKIMRLFRARPADARVEDANLYSEKTIKYTATKPMIIWSENPSCATDFYMPKNMLLENCDQSAASIFRHITSKSGDLKAFSINETKFQKNRAWYPCSDFLVSSEFSNEKHKKSGREGGNFIRGNEFDLNPFYKEKQEEEGKQNLGNLDKKVSSGQNHKAGKKESSQKKGEDNSLERQIRLVNDSYLSDDESESRKIKEMIVGNLKVQVDLDLNSVKVPSKWDSDYENENFEKRSTSGKEVDMEIASLDEDVSIYSGTTAEKSFTNELLNNTEVAVNENLMRTKGLENANLKNEKEDSPSQKPMDAKTESLASEYEEFLKMVSFEPSYNTTLSANEKYSTDPMKSDKQKNIKAPNSGTDLKKEKLESTDWDKDSDHEEISPSKISKKGIESNNFLTVNEEKPISFKKEVKKELASKKKIKMKKNKELKKRSKTKKRKYNSSSSSDSSSDSYDSESDSESDEKKSSKKKKKKVSKPQKKSKKYSSSDSDSDSSDSSASSKEEFKKKSSERKKKNRYSGEDKPQSVLLKELDFKKQLIMKKIEAIDSISEKNEKRKEKNKKARKKENSADDDSDSQDLKLDKKKTGITKNTTGRKKSKDSSKGWNDNRDFLAEKSTSSGSDSDSEYSASKLKKKKINKTGKKKRNSSESSTSEEKQNKVEKFIKGKKLIDLDKGIKKMKKTKRQKKKTYSSSDSDGNSSKSKKKMKKSRKKTASSKEMEKEKLGETSWQDNFLFETKFKTEDNGACWDDTKLRDNDISKKYTSFNISKEKNDWEANSSLDESAPDNKDGNSSWDDEIPSSKTRENQSTKEKEDSRGPSNFSDFKINSCEDTFGKEAEAPVISKSSASNFSFSENSFNSYEQDYSRNFLLHEPSFSNSAQFGDSRNLENCTIDARPFQSISKSNLAPVHNKSELYSPGHSDSELSDSDLHIKNEKINKDSQASNISRDDIYDPLNSESEGSQKNMEVELSNIPLPSVSEILLPGELRNEDEISGKCNKTVAGIELKPSKTQKSGSNKLLIQQEEPKSVNFPSVQYGLLNQEDKIPMKKQIISMKPLQKLKSKAASVFQDESDEEIIEGTDKAVGASSTQNDAVEKGFAKSKIIDKETVKISDMSGEGEGETNLREEKKPKRNIENDLRTKRQESKEREVTVRSSEKKGHLLTGKNNTQAVSPVLSASKTSDLKFSNSKVGQQEIKSDSFEIEPLERNIDCKEEIETLQTIPVLTGLSVPSVDGHSWTRSHLPGYSCQDFRDERISMNNSESFDIYPSGDSKYRDSAFEDCIEPYENLEDNSNFEKYSQKTEKSKREKRKSRSRSLSPRKKRRSRTPDRRRSPKRKSATHKFRNESPYSPRKRSPKRKSPSRWHRNSRSPDRRRKSRSRSPRKRRSSPFRRSRSFSPRKHRSPKRRGDSPRRRESQAREPCRESTSPRKDFSHLYSDSSLQNRIPVIGASGENEDVKLDPSVMRGSPTGFTRHLPDSAIADPDANNGFYSREYLNEFGVSNYPCEVGLNNLITVKNHEFEKGNSPERLSLDQRIELELGVQLSTGSQCQNEHYPMQNQVPFSDINSAHFPNSYSCDNNNSNNENFYPNQNIGLNSEFNGQFFNGHQQQLPYGSFQQFSNNQPIQNSVLQVGNIVEVVPTMQHQPVPPPSKSHQIMQVGNVLQVVPSQKAGQGSPDSYGHPSNASPIPQVKTQKATAVVAPSSIVPPPNPETIINPLIKAIQLEREKRKKEKEKRRAEREARRKARQLRREAKLMSVNEKLKKSVQDEGLMLGQEVEDDELLDALDLPASPIPVEIITVSSPSTLPPAGKGILITAGFMQKPPSEKKEVKFADGVCPGEGTSTSGGEDIVSPPPKPKLPKEKRYKKKKTKVKKKVKVQIIRQIIQEDDDEDDLSPPPPPPGDPPPVFFARFPFASNAQFPVYHTQQTTTTLTTIQYPTPAFQ